MSEHFCAACHPETCTPAAVSLSDRAADGRARTATENMDASRSLIRMPLRQPSVLIFLTCGIWLIGLGLYFVLLRPALLPEDAAYMVSSATKIRSAVPGLSRWLRHVFTVMGGFMTASGVLMTFLAATAIPARRKGTGAVLVVTGLATVVTMSWINFAIDSNFKWLLLAPAILWGAGIVAYALERRS